MNNYTLQDVKEYLLDLAKNGSSMDYGVCVLLIQEYNFKIDTSVYENYSDWSGYNIYPIKPDNSIQNSIKTKDEASDAYLNLPRWSGEYGKNRREFCLWLASNLQGYFVTQDKYGVYHAN